MSAAIQSTIQPVRARVRVPAASQISATVAPVAAPAEVVQLVQPQGLEAKLAEFWRLNTAANAAARAAEKAKKVLNEAMIEAGTQCLQAEVALGTGEVQPVVAQISAEPKEVISVEKLKALVSEEAFMRIISATKTAVVENAGTNVAVAATVLVSGKEALSVKKAA
jgi:hypothetical protein